MAHTQRRWDAVFRAIPNGNWVETGTELKTLKVLALVDGQSKSIMIGDGHCHSESQVQGDSQSHGQAWMFAPA